ncbi:zinc-binding dehydrogenase [Streptomyces griseorubiginosus]|uniref:zinc-binding dehydrogenase n=1 Tax=Streptomyces griseorubiginosus TaxID=67304 RepID=UPI0036E6FD41
MTGMRAAVLDVFGAHAPAVRDVLRPEPEPGRVLIRVVAAGLNPIDNGIRLGRSPYAQPALPAIVGTDVAGIVEAVGDGVDGFSPGDRVFGLTGGVRGEQGSLAQFQSADPALLAHAPDTLPLRQAAALPLVTLTAWEALQAMQVGAGSRLLIQAGAGGVGHVATQIAVASGADVTATVSPGKAALVEAWGATAVDYTRTDVMTRLRDASEGGFDAVFDTVGGPGLEQSFLLARQHGDVASCAAFGRPCLQEASLRFLTLHPVYVLLPLTSGRRRAAHGAFLRRTAELVDSGRLRPVVDERRFTLDDLSAAYTAVGDGSAYIKIVVDIAADPSPLR